MSLLPLLVPLRSHHMFAWCLISGVLAGSGAVSLPAPGIRRAGHCLNTLILADLSEAAFKSSQGSHLGDEDVVGSGLADLKSRSFPFRPLSWSSPHCHPPQPALTLGRGLTLRTSHFLLLSLDLLNFS